jgi:hypothetical protein
MEPMRVLTGIQRIDAKPGAPTNIVLYFVGIKVGMNDYDQRQMIRWFYKYKPELVKKEIESMDKFNKK